jgi:hypothetical protein
VYNWTKRIEKKRREEESIIVFIDESRFAHDMPRTLGFSFYLLLLKTFLRLPF